jgi:hypothetical protein
VCGDRVRFSRALQHEQLGQNGDRLQPNGESPKDLDNVSRMSVPGYPRMVGKENDVGASVRTSESR